uniref:Peptidase S1 domain-containing protein n=1 Tax=Daphnia galeata TaxID=27404 RepID=A0A8J2S595_9CRUS|nr:unnamed protein product [Daphnia galeata]
MWHMVWNNASQFFYKLPSFRIEHHSPLVYVLQLIKLMSIILITMRSTIVLIFLVSCVFSSSLPDVDSWNSVDVEDKTLRESDANDEENDLIVGGTAAAAGEFPFQVAIKYNGNFFCGGSLISPSIVLTAAHCLARQSQSSASRLSVIVNTLSLNGGPGSVTRGVRKFVIHGSYNSRTSDNDVALIALSSPVTNVAFVKLPSALAGSYSGNSAVIAGWGTTSSGGRISQRLLKASVTVSDNSACNRQYGGSITSNMICAAGPGKDTCQGDSGGPLLVAGVQVGVTSFGRGCADPRYAGVYARVSRYVDWIKTNSATI